MSFYIGQKVVCINDQRLIPDRMHPVSLWITKGSIYEIRWFGPSPDPAVLYEPTVRLVGINRGEDASGNPDWFDLPFCAFRFRPLIEKSTEAGVEVLKQIARDVTERKPVKITERA